MHARHRSAILLSLFVLLVFIARWPIDSYTCDPARWKDPVTGKLWRPTRAEGSSFFSTIFKGGSGTPAIFAMLGGQRYMVANITWNYSDILFHKQKIYDMIDPLESTVTLNPSFTEAWSTYGWHMAWNLYADSKDIIEKEKWQQLGTDIYLRAIQANPDRPIHRGNLARIYMERVGNYRKALNVLEPVVFPDKSRGDIFIGPLTTELKKKPTDINVLCERYWEPYDVGHRLAIIYRKLGMYTGDWEYFKKAVKVYEICLDADAEHRQQTQGLIDKLQARIDTKDMQWLRESRKTDEQIRQNAMLPPIKYDLSMETLFPDGTTGLDEEPRY